MAVLFDILDRKVIPNWRDFKRTTLLGELGSHQMVIPKNVSIQKVDFKKLISDWRSFRTLAHAGDLIGSAFILKVGSNPNVKEAIDFVLDHPQIAPSPLFNMAKSMKYPENEEEYQLLEHSDFSEFIQAHKLREPRKKIHDLRERLKNQPYNSILWIEFARQYSLVGQLEKARRAIKIALSYSINNRYVLRSAIRFFIHVGELDTAKYYLRKSEITTHDTWLMPVAIALNIKRRGKTDIVKKGLKLLSSKSYSPFSISELASSIATLELENGKYRQSKKLFDLALTSPNDNTLAQVEWASTQDHRLAINEEKFLNVKNPFEALSLLYYSEKEWDKAFKNIKNWFLDMPFSADPILMGSYIAANYLEDQEKSIQLCEAGLIANPDNPSIINNLCYSLALNGQVPRAEKLLFFLKDNPKLSLVNNITLTATRGLISFRKGELEQGRHFYNKAISIAQESNRDELATKALINLAREEILNSTHEAENTFNAMMNACEYYSEDSFFHLKTQVISLFKSWKTKKLKRST